MTSNRLNRVMKTLTGASIILMTMAMLAGVWGMNFVNMPELDWRFGYGFALLVIGGSGLGLYTMLRRKDYL
jgi:magnesium transporter